MRQSVLASPCRVGFVLQIRNSPWNILTPRHGSVQGQFRFRFSFSFGIKTGSGAAAGPCRRVAAPLRMTQSRLIHSNSLLFFFFTPSLPVLGRIQTIRTIRYTTTRNSALSRRNAERIVEGVVATPQLSPSPTPLCQW